MERTMSDPITVLDFPEIRWNGHWIWVPEEPVARGDPILQSIDPRAPEAHGLFRKTLDLDAERVPARVPARITADSRYVLFANGREVFRGPIRSQPRRLYYDFFDLAPYLQPGRNLLAVHVKYYGTPKSFWIPAVPNMTLGKTGILVFEADLGAAGWLISDGSWKARKAGAWSGSWQTGAENMVATGLPIEVFDARELHTAGEKRPSTTEIGAAPRWYRPHTSAASPTRSRRPTRTVPSTRDPLPSWAAESRYRSDNAPRRSLAAWTRQSATRFGAWRQPPRSGWARR